MTNKMKVTKHNGRAGKNGVYNPKHNDRSFNVTASEHIDQELMKQNIYWDWIRGYSGWEDHNPDEDFLDLRFENVERTFYFHQYDDFCEAQHERNRIAGHSKRDRSTEDLRLSKKTCPEESLIQIGCMEHHVEPEVLLAVAQEYFAKYEELFGEHVHILDWGLHCDESTPHIHERHVFDCENEYGEIAPQQEKALEALGIERPYPDQPNSRTNNRKITFDSICRTMLIDIAKAHGLEIEEEPSYGGRAYLEKQEYIREKQKKVIADQEQKIARQKQTIDVQAYDIFRQKAEIHDKNAELLSVGSELRKAEEQLDELTMKVEDVEVLVDEVTEIAYDKAVEQVADIVRKETTKANISEIRSYQKWAMSEESKVPKKQRELVSQVLDAVVRRIRKAVSIIAEKVTAALCEPGKRSENIRFLKKEIKPSVVERLQKKQEVIKREKTDKPRAFHRSEISL